MPQVFKKVTIYVENEDGESEILTIERCGDISIQEIYSELEDYPRVNGMIQVPRLEKIVMDFDVYKTPEGTVYTIQKLDKDGNPRD